LIADRRRATSIDEAAFRDEWGGQAKLGKELSRASAAGLESALVVGVGETAPIAITIVPVASADEVSDRLLRARAFTVA